MSLPKPLEGESKAAFMSRVINFLVGIGKPWNDAVAMAYRMAEENGYGRGRK